jgi:tetraacyldisaccharide 4'-kinase
MKAPDFWQHKGPLVPLLLPLSGLFHLIGQIRNHFVHPYHSRLPVICIGNVVAGGAGKTPTAIYLAQQLANAGWRPALLSRGYGGRRAGPHLVDPQLDTAELVGDEALLLAMVAQTWVARDRAAGARAIEADDCDLIIMDDGFQNPQLEKTISLLVVDQEQGFGNQCILPAGPLREPISAAIARTDAIITYGHGKITFAAGDAAGDRPVFSALLESVNGAEFKGQRCLAFAGIGRPEKFYQSLAAAGATVVDTVGFPDHHSFTAGDADLLVKKAAAADAILVTTAKDHVRCPNDLRQQAKILHVAPAWTDAQSLLSWLETQLKKSHS